MHINMDMSLLKIKIFCLYFFKFNMPLNNIFHAYKYSSETWRNGCMSLYHECIPYTNQFSTVGYLAIISNHY